VHAFHGCVKGAVAEFVAHGDAKSCLRRVEPRIGVWDWMTRMNWKLANKILLLAVVSLWPGSAAFGALTLNAFVADLQALPSYQVRVMTTDAVGSGYPTAPLPGTPDYVNGVIQRNNGRGELRIESANPNVGAAWDEVYFTPSWASSPWVYETFCIERGEGISFGTSYYATLDDGAWYGTNGSGPATPAPDPLSNTTKLLFGLYADGRLDNVILNNAASNNNDYSYTSNSDAERLQNIFWNLEDVNSLTTTEAAWLQVVQAWALANPLDAALYQAGVKVVNLWDTSVVGMPYPSAAHAIQSFLIYLQSPSQIPGVPEPMSLAVWGGIFGLGLAVKACRIRRKRIG
jgi:hypothetical protein